MAIMTNQQRFESKFKIEPFGHWLWTAGKTGSGHGSFKVNGKNYGAHVYSMYLYNNFDLDSNTHSHVLHKPECNNKLCVNPDHLYIGTHQENMRDKQYSTHCPNNHEFTQQNTRYNRNGSKYCTFCKRDRAAEYKSRLKERN